MRGLRVRGFGVSLTFQVVSVGSNIQLRVQALKYRALGSKYYDLNGVWGLNLLCFGLWTLKPLDPRP